MQSNFTPAPWKLHEDGTIHSVDNLNNIIAIMPSWGNSDTINFNARLIANAPTLWEILNTLIEAPIFSLSLSITALKK